MLEGEDDVPRQPSPPFDPYTPEPGPSPGERRAFKFLPLAWVVVFVLAEIILYAVFPVTVGGQTPLAVKDLSHSHG